MGFEAFGQTWKLERASYWYKGDHLLQKVEGYSKQGQGFILCKDKCKFALEVPAKSFYSKVQKHNKRIYKALKAEEFSAIRVNGVSNGLTESSEFEIRIELAGASKVFRVKGLTVSKEKNLIVISGNFNFKLSDFKIERPKFFGFKMKDPISTRFELVYKQQ